MGKIDFSIRQLRHFALVAELKSFKAAAEKASRSQPALSLSIKQLEDALGEPLFEKGSRANLTPFGEQCLPQAREMVARHDDLARQFRGSAQAETGEVTVALLPSLATRWLPEFVKRFAQSHPNVLLRMEDDNTSNIYESVISGRVDFGIASVIEADRQLEIEPILKDHFGVVCSSRHRFAKTRKPLRWSQLGQEVIVGNLTHRMLETSPVGRYVERPRLFVANMTSLMAIVAGGLGVSPVPALAVPRGAAGIVFAALTAPNVRREVALIRRRGRRLSPAARAAESLIRQVVESD